MATIKGSHRNDKLSGTKHADTIFGRGGNDRVDGGKGDDTLLGGSGNDRLDGDKGNDLLFGGSGCDKLEGGKGNDLLFGGSGNDKLDGGKGNDVLFGGSGNDKLEGGKGHDLLFGGSGHDKLEGGKGNDKLVGGAGGDKVTGGRGMDLFVYLAAFDSTIWDWDRITDFTQGEDKIDLSALLGASDLAWGDKTPTASGAWYESSGRSTFVFVDTGDDGVADMKIELKNTTGLELSADDFLGVSVGRALFTENDDSVDFNTIFAADYTGGTQYDALGGNDSVTLSADAAAAVTAGFDPAQGFSGGAGDDRITMFVTNPLNVDGGPDNDTLILTGDVPGDPPSDVVVIDLSAPDQVVSIGGVNDDFVQTGFENVDASGLGSSVQVTGDAGANVIFGSHGADVIDGGEGNDTIAGGPGHDTIKGGSGDDVITMLVTPGDVDAIDAGDGKDTLLLTGDVGGEVAVDLSATDATKQIGFENLDASGLGAGSFVAVTSSVVGAGIVGSNGADTIFAFGQGSTVLGGAGADTVFIGSSANLVNGGPGNDLMLNFAPGNTFKFSFELMNGAASSDDGFDVIVLFDAGSNKMRFDFSADQGWDAGLADNSAKLAFLEDLFKVESGMIALDDDTWSVDAGSLNQTDPFAAVDMYVNDVLIG